MSSSHKNPVSVVIPAHNEKDGISDVVRAISDALNNSAIPHEIIVVDDGSTDGMSALLPALPVRAVRHETKKGYGRSLAYGIETAQHDTIAILDADATYPCEDLPHLLERYEPERMVVGWRKILNLPGARLPKSFARKFLHLLARLLTGEHIVDLNSGFRVFSKNFWEQRKSQFPSGFSFTTTLTLLTYFAGQKITYVPIEYRPRKGSTKVHYLYDGIRVALWMIKLTWKNRPERLVFPLVLLLAFALRLVGIGFGLPGQAYPDEPHHINLAVYFGSGDLNPHIFKYPTLWMYTLFGAYGGFFVLWSGFGFLKSISQFSDLFVWNITPFYLIGRGLAATFGVLAIIPLYRAGRRLFNSDGAAICACFFFAISPPLIAYSHQAKADMMMLFLSTMAWMFCVFYYKDGGLKNAVAAGLAIGLACSTQYTAVLLTPLLPLAHFMRVTQQKNSSQKIISKEICLGILMTPLAFLITTPFSWIDHSTFLNDLNDIRSYGEGSLATDTVRLGIGSLKYFYEFTGAGPLGAVILACAFFYLFWKKTGEGIFLAAPLIWTAVLLGLQNRQAGVVNYAFPVFPGCALGLGALWLMIKPVNISPRKKLLGLFLLCLPGLLIAAKKDLVLCEKDTRIRAMEWIQSHIPSGKKFLLDQPHTMPPLQMNRDQVQRLLNKTRAENHPRALYYERMLKSHPGGGYEIFLISKTATELITMKKHSEWSKKGQELLDLENGIEDAEKAGIDYIVWSSAGITFKNSPRLNKFLKDLEDKATLLQEFVPSLALYPLISPLIKIYAVKTLESNATQ